MRTRIVATVWIAVLSAMVLGALLAPADDNDEPYPETTLILELQAAIRVDDKGWFVSPMHYPVRYVGKTNYIIRSKDSFLSHYDEIISPELKASILTQDSEHFVQGLSGPDGR